MIDTRNIDDLDPRLMNLLKQFRRIQVSKYPLIAVGTNPTKVTFVDSRFTKMDEYKHKVVGELFLDRREVSKGDVEPKEETVFVVESYLINNGRFIGRRAKQIITKDPQKALKNVQAYVRPFSGSSISRWTQQKAMGAFQDWTWNVKRDARDTMSIDMKVIYEEVKRMRELGIRAQTEAFQKAIDEGIDKFETMRAVENKNFNELVHVFFNPDDTVTVTPQKNTDAIASEYPSIDVAPYELSSRVGMLRMMEVDAYVPQVGVKLNDRTFWVDMGD
jgi:hypothetical protein